MENSEKYLRVNAIKNGTVLDHIPSEQIFRVIDILGIADSTNPVTFGINLESRSMGKKGIIKTSHLCGSLATTASSAILLCACSGFLSRCC